jgi:hypothetical protein
MSTLFGNQKPAGRARGQVGMFALFALATTLVLALAAFVGIVL